MEPRKYAGDYSADGPGHSDGGADRSYRICRTYGFRRNLRGLRTLNALRQFFLGLIGGVLGSSKICPEPILLRKVPFEQVLLYPFNSCFQLREN